MQKIPFLDLKQLNAPYMDALKAAAAQVVESGWYIRGSFCEKFEKAFADYCGVKYAVGVGNGLDGLTLMLRAEIELGRLNAGDEILVPSNTYIATLLAVSAAGLVPVLVEPCEKSFNMDPARLDASCGPRTRGILVVHLYGRLADMPAICKFAKERGLLLFEDCAQAHGARLSAAAGDPQACNRPRFAGSFGAAAAYSFYPTKNLGALGDAGMVVTDDAEIARVVRMLGNYGSERKYVNEFPGVNSRLDEMQAALLLQKLPNLDRDNARRREIAERYLAEVKNPLLVLPEPPADPQEHVWHVFTLRAGDPRSGTCCRDALQKYLEARGIGTLIFYPIPPHLQQAYASGYALRIGEPVLRFSGPLGQPVAESLAMSILSVPLNPALTDAQVSEIIGALNEFVC